ncbi:hypothetical protein [Streptomyces litchfieldiae]|uniref:Integral membrane protein n=1 Tax=Streptomyces litchfieldiae TaxID=3075543 RepID=A0ABU2N125_9ACTN|nr:hypothetical protein [Streptomyces sp. DSM 44938]MDT0347612.1 hypothetical protein [Streptomyces sp. DSM 44938]
MDLLITLGPCVALVSLIMCTYGLIAHAIRRLREGGRPRLASPKPLALVSGVSASAAVLLLAYAVWTYATAWFAGPEDTCLRTVGTRVRPESESILPASLVCDGVELVPSWVNPTVFGLAGLATVTFTAAVWCAVAALPPGRPRES